MHVVGIACLPESGNMRDHEPRIDFPHRRVIETPLLIRTRPRTFHPDVRARGEADEQLASARLGEIQRDAKYVAPLLDPAGRDARLAVLAGEIDPDFTPS